MMSCCAVQAAAVRHADAADCGGGSSGAVRSGLGSGAGASVQVSSHAEAVLVGTHTLPPPPFRLLLLLCTCAWRRTAELYRYGSSSSLSFTSWAAFASSALAVTRLNTLSILSGLAVVLVNWLVTLAVRRLTVLERWHTRTAGERWALLKLSGEMRAAYGMLAQRSLACLPPDPAANT